MTSVDVWKECMQWLRRCGIALPENIKPTQSREFFSRYLRDGVLLCHLIHLLNPKALEYFFDVSELICMDPDKNEELCLQNIESFLLICQTDFGLKPSDLFDPKMLYHLTDFDRVLHTLSQLSKSPIVTQLGITEFPIPPRRSSVDGAISSQTEILPGNSRASGAQMFRSISSIYEPANEVMYMCLISDFDSSTRLHDTEALPNDPVERAVKKMLNAENDYINILTVMEEKMFRHLSKILTPKEQTIIFYGIKELNQIHQQIQRELLTATGNQQNKSLTKVYIVFLNWKDRLHVYHRYAANLPSALHVVGAVYRGKKEVAKEVELAQASLSDRFKLTNLLLKPIQHVSQYSVILQEIRKYIPEYHEDYNGLKYASQSMSELEETVNAIKKDSFLLQSLEHVHSTICGWKHSKPSTREFGRLFKDGLLRASCSMANDNNYKIKYQVFLFSRTVVFCSPQSGIRNLRRMSRNEQFTYQFRLILQNCSVDELAGLTGFFEDATIPWTSSWRVKGPKGQTSVTFYSKTHEERLKWIESFKDVMAQLHPSLDNDDASTHTFELQTFSSVVDCHVCHKLLKGLLDQGYRCTKCKECFHKQCLETAKRCSMVDEEIYTEILTPLDFEQESGIHEIQSLDSSSQSGESSSRTEKSSDTNLEPPAIVQQVERSVQSDDSLESQLWFGGSMSALEATAHLIGTSPGTFLVRKREETNPDAFSAPYAISVMMKCGVKHIKVQCFRSQPEDSEYLTLGSSWSKQEFFLVPGCTFPTINDLVYCYMHNFLSEEVSLAMDVYLKIPFKITKKTINSTNL